MKKLLSILFLIFFWLISFTQLSLAQNNTSIKDMWIDCWDNGKNMTNWQCKFNVYKFVWIKKEIQDNPSVWIFVQDIVLSSTMIIWTIVTIVLIVSWLLFVFSWVNSSLKDKARKWIINWFIGLVIVMSSYFIIRLVQYLVKGN